MTQDDPDDELQGEADLIEPNLIDINAHLHAIFHPDFVKPYTDAWIEIAIANPKGNIGPNASKHFSVFELKEAAAYAARRNREGKNVYVGMALRQGETGPSGRASKKNVVTASRTWADFDKFGDAANVQTFMHQRGLKAAEVIVTGTIPHPRFQVFFRLAGNVTPDQIEAVNEAMKTSLGGNGDGVQNADRVMQLAGTVSYPPPKKVERGYVPELTKLTVNADPHAFDPDELIRLIQSNPEPYLAQNKSKSSKSSSKASGASNGGERKPGRSDSELEALLECSRKEGEWHNAMRDAIATMIGREWSDSAIRLACKPYCIDGYGDADLDDFIDRARTKWNVPDGEQQVDAEPCLLEARPFVLRDPKMVPPRQWIYGRHLIRKFGSATFAPSSSGKTSLLLTEALAIATGRPLLDVLPLQRARVWYWNGEDPYDELERRIGAACLQHKIAPAEIEGWLFINSGRDPGSQVVVASQNRDGVTIATPVVDALVRTIRDNKIDVVMIDPFISSHRVPENDNNAIDIVAKTWTGIADVTNTAIDLAHHTRKTGGAEVTVEDGRGAVALLNAVRSARVLNAMTEDEANSAGVIDSRRRYFRVTDGKNNLALPAEKMDWFCSVSINLGNGKPGDPTDRGDDMGVVTTWEWPDAPKVSVEDFEKVKAEIKAGEWRLSSQAKAWVGHAVARVLGLGDVRQKGVARSKVNKMVGNWIYQRQLVVVERQDENRQLKDFVEVAEPTTIDLSKIEVKNSVFT